MKSFQGLKHCCHFFLHSYPLNVFSANRLICSQSCTLPGVEPYLVMEAHKMTGRGNSVYCGFFFEPEAPLGLEEYALFVWLSSSVCLRLLIRKMRISKVALIVLWKSQLFTYSYFPKKKQYLVSAELFSLPYSQREHLLERDARED